MFGCHSTYITVNDLFSLLLQAIDRGEVVNYLAFSSVIERKLGGRVWVCAHVVCWKTACDSPCCYGKGKQARN